VHAPQLRACRKRGLGSTLMVSAPDRQPLRFICSPGNRDYRPHSAAPVVIVCAPPAQEEQLRRPHLTTGASKR